MQYSETPPEYIGPATVVATRLVKRLKGGSQPHLVECSDGTYCVVKFRNTPQHRRVLVNEWIGSRILQYLGIDTPGIRLVEFSTEFISKNGIGMRFGNVVFPVSEGLHFGSEYPGDPTTTMVFDLVPDPFLVRLHSPEHFWGVLMFDKWVSNADSRQCIFFRSRGDCDRAGALRRPDFLARMIDHGHIFGGRLWEFGTFQYGGLFERPIVYESVHSLDVFAPWLRAIERFPESILVKARGELPATWTEGDQMKLDDVLEEVMRRRAHMAGALSVLAMPPVSLFPRLRRNYPRHGRRVIK